MMYNISVHWYFVGLLLSNTTLFSCTCHNIKTDEENASVVY